MPARRRARSRSACESRLTDAAPSSSRTCTASASIRAGFHPAAGRGPELLLEHGLVHRAAPRQPGGLQLDADQRTRRLRGEQQAQRVRVDAGGDERELARELGDDRSRRTGRARIGDAGRESSDSGVVAAGCRRNARADVGRDVGGGEVVEIEERAVRHRRHGGLAGDRAAAVGRAGREPRRARVTSRMRGRPRSPSSDRGSPRTGGGRGIARHAPLRRGGADTTAASRSRPSADARAPRARARPRRARRDRRRRSGVAGSSGSTRAMRPRSTAATTICTGPFSRSPTTVSAGSVTMDAWTSGRGDHGRGELPVRARRLGGRSGRRGDPAGMPALHAARRDPSLACRADPPGRVAVAALRDRPRDACRRDVRLAVRPRARSIHGERPRGAHGSGVPEVRASTPPARARCARGAWRS